MSQTTIDFNDLSKGEIVNGQYVSEGVTFSSGTDANPLMIFDSANPTGGDTDLKYDGLGNILILSEDKDSTDPDDNAGGGTIRIDFDEPSTVQGLTVLDADEAIYVALYREDGTLIGETKVQSVDNGRCDLTGDVADVSYMIVTLTGSGAIDNLVFTPPAPALDGIVEGDDSANYIDGTYDERTVGEEGDFIDNNDALGGASGTAGSNDDSVQARGGDDTVNSGLGSDTVDGGTGNDRIEGDDGADSLMGGAGDDVIVGYDSTSIKTGGIEVSHDDGANDTLDGGEGNDLLAGGAGDDSLVGDSGQDTLIGGTGSDTLLGGHQADSLVGGDGNDTIDGGADVADDTLDGGAGDDSLTAGSGADLLYGGDGADTLDGSFGADTIHGGAGGDGINGGSGADSIYGEDGDDTVSGGAGWDRIFGGAGDDSVAAGTGSDRVYGEEGRDTLDGGDANDTIDGGTGADTIKGGSGNDSILGGDEGDDGTTTVATVAPISLTADKFDQAASSKASGDFSDRSAFDWQEGDVAVYSGVGETEDGRTIDAKITLVSKPADVGVSLSHTDTQGNVLLLDGPDAEYADFKIEFFDSATGQPIFVSSELTTADLDKVSTGTEDIRYVAEDIDYYATSSTTNITVTENDGFVTGSGNADNTAATGGTDNQDHWFTVGFSGSSVNFSLSPRVSNSGFGFKGEGLSDPQVTTVANGDDIMGGAGDDTIDGQGGNDTITGDAGDDRIIGGDGRDSLSGGDDRDTFVGATDGDTVDGGTGSTAADDADDYDVLDLTGVKFRIASETDDADGNSTSGIIELLDDADNVVGTVTFSEIEEILGRAPVLDGIVEGNDDAQLIDANWDETTIGEEGDRIDNNDALGGASGTAGSNDDSVQAGGGNDTIRSGEGNDTVDAGSGDDSIDGGSGDDRILTGFGNDSAEGGTGNDTIVGSSGDDTLKGGDDDDQLFGGSGTDDLSGGAGNDTVVGGTGNDDILGGSGDDVIQGLGGSDSIDAGSGNDYVEGDGTDTVTSFEDDDTIDTGDGCDTVFGGVGDDVITAGITGSPDRGFPTDPIVGIDGDIENDRDYVDGGDGNDSISTGDDRDTVLGGSGADTIDGGFDDDLIEGGTGTDSIIGGEGSDTIRGQDDDDTIYGGLGAGNELGNFIDLVDPIQDNGRDVLFGDGGNDVIYGQDDDDLIIGGTGDDTLDGGIDEDSLYGGEGNDSILGGQGDDTAEGEAGTDVIDGGAGRDAIQGGAGDDTLYGGLGSDKILGNEDDDLIYGDDGDQTASGPERSVIDWETFGEPGTDRFDSEQFSGATGTVGGVDITISVSQQGTFQNNGTENYAEFDEAFLPTSGIDGDVAPDSSLKIASVDDPNTVGIEFGNAVTNVQFYVGDLDSYTYDPAFPDDQPWQDQVTIRAYDADGNQIDVSVTPGSNVSGADTDSVAGDDQFTGSGGPAEPGDVANSIFVEIAGPVARIEIVQDDLESAGNQAGKINIGNVAFDQPVDDCIIGGDGDDTVFGEEGDDTIYGEAGDDVVVGGDGADFIDTGDDRDVIIGGSDGDKVYGGSGGGPLGPNGVPVGDYDTLDLTGSGPLRLVDVTPDSNGNGFDGTVQFLDGDGNVIGELCFWEIECIIPCFTPGTLIATPQGERPVEDLVPGDRVITRDSGIQVVRWTGAKALSEADLAGDPSLRPVIIRQGALGHGLPERDMTVSPQHRVLMMGDETELYFEEREVLVAAKHLVGRPGIERAEASAVTYVHVMFDSHEVILSDGAWTESFQPGERTLAGIGRSQREEIFRLFPELRAPEGQARYGAARRSLRRREAELLAR